MGRPTEIDLQWLQQNHPALFFFRSARATIVEGVLSFNHTDQSGRVAIDDSYSIKIVIPDARDRSPYAYETGGRLKGVMKERRLKDLADLHCYKTGKLCLAAPQELTLEFLRDPSLERFIEGYLVPFLYSQSYYAQNNGNWLWPHWRHDAKGLLDWFDDNAHVDGAARETVRELRRLKTEASIGVLARGARPDSFNRRARCLCGRNKSYMECHKHLIGLAFHIRGAAIHTSGHKRKKRSKRRKRR
jgi:hypothetical protein